MRRARRGDLTYLRVLLDPLHSLLLRLALARAVHLLQRLLLLLLDLARVGAALVLLQRLRADVETLAVLAHAKVGLRLSQIGADELRITLDGLVAVLHGAGEGQQLDEGGGSVAVSAGVVGRALDHLAVGFHSAGPVGFLELLVALFAGFLGLGGVDVGLLLVVDLRLFGGAELGEEFGRAVLGERLLVVGDGVGEVAELLVGAADATKGPAEV